ncbi:protein huluwa-like [Podarcis raffonei]|uniref:protein huluwa-like n=1 Tax=Podarcis raffonei TaxID=65483 RepID=UPI0023294A31|nr:protein huluwa-like [Podarcis raffonei]
MDPPAGVEEQTRALQPTLRLLVGLLIPCLLLLFLLNLLLLLGWRPTCRRVGRRELGQAPPASPQLFQVVSGSAVLRQDGKGRVVLQQLLQPAEGPGGPRAFPLPMSCSGRAAASSGSRSRGTPRPHRSSQAPLRGHPGNGASRGTVSSSSDQDKQTILVPPNTPESGSGTGGIPDGTFSRCHTSTQNKVCRSSRPVSATHPQAVPFEHGSSIRCEDQRAQLNSANFTASQGPGLDSDFGASAGVSVRILSDCEASPGTPLLGRLFEWDYYDPTYKREDQLSRQLPPVRSKQYWL